MTQGKRACVYSDEGASSWCVRCTCSMLRDYNYTCTLLTARDIAADTWSKSCDLLVFPGGRDTPYHEKLTGVPNQTIRSYVEGGGRYLGFCAGGYYGSRHIEFCKGDPGMEVLADRELQFFPGTAVGPVYPGFKYTDNAGEHVVEVTRVSARRSSADNARRSSADNARYVTNGNHENDTSATNRCVSTNNTVTTTTNNTVTTTTNNHNNDTHAGHCKKRKTAVSEHVYFNGGCYFRPDTVSPDTVSPDTYTTIRNYLTSDITRSVTHDNDVMSRDSVPHDNDTCAAPCAAVIGVVVGGGRVVLSGVHPEVGYQDVLDTPDTMVTQHTAPLLTHHTAHVIKELRAYGEERKTVLRDIFKYLETSDEC